ncbi:hypothetical protein MARLIPOL_02675 [Marinobacter lipolyticus SM19]|uniref:Lipoprotein n=1 Tax=Marinobacter lipolyticus SM19 TaxID=1318628 RepID=R8B4X1_9GAMM|nr:hypothetical protein [Marinobacter lipolyticus]EON93574.1 hypothetical protein MARLIPOL_02675 [Marinobacter lipolyticus SM19]
MLKLCRPHQAFNCNLLPLILVAWALGGCAGQPATPPVAPLTSEACTTAWQDVERQLQQAGIQDAQGAQIPNRPYLRVNRTLADFNLADLTRAERHDWLHHALINGERALHVRLARLEKRHMFDPGWLMHCARQQVAVLATDSRQWADLVSNVKVPDAYLDWRRTLGAYPLIRPVLAYQVRRLQASQLRMFGAQTDKPGVRQFSPKPPEPDPAVVTSILIHERSRDRLGLPVFSQDGTEKILATHAPHLVMATEKPYDRPGTPRWKDGRWVIEPPARAYTLVTQVRWQNQWLPQLVYVFWFDERPKPHPLDIYGGRLDGLIWRVTLDENGQVLMYDSVHPCGCYHQWYPLSDRLRLNPDAVGDEIMTVLPLKAPDNQQAMSRPIVHLASGTHYVANVSFSASPDPKTDSTPYELIHYDRLRALPDSKGVYRSLFLPNGLVAGTERLERFLLWGTGVLSPGAMRQWGHHATAFIGKRHFDDPDLLNRYFEPVQVSEQIPGARQSN